LLLVLTACSLNALSQQKVGKEQVGRDSAFHLEVSSYYCSSSWFLKLQVKKECNEYIADWRTSYGRLTLNKPDSARVILTQRQFAALIRFAQQPAAKANHKGYCRGTIVVEFRIESLQILHRLCECSAESLSDVYSITNNTRQGSVQHQL